MKFLSVIISVIFYQYVLSEISGQILVAKIVTHNMLVFWHTLCYVFFVCAIIVWFRLYCLLFLSTMFAWWIKILIMLLLYKYAPKDRATRHVITGHLSNLQLSSCSTITAINKNNSKRTSGGMLERAVKLCQCLSVMVNGVLKRGSSKLGNALLASLGWNLVVANQLYTRVRTAVHTCTHRYDCCMSFHMWCRSLVESYLIFSLLFCIVLVLL